MNNFYKKIKNKRLKKKINLKNKKIEIQNDLIYSHCEILNVQDYVYIGPRNKLYGQGIIHIGSNSIIGPDVTIFTSIHDYQEGYLPYGFQDIIKDVHIGDNVWIGASVIIMPGVHIGEGSVIGAGTIVTKDVLPLSVLAGNPGKVINNRGNEYYDLLNKNKMYLKKKWG